MHQVELRALLTNVESKMAAVIARASRESRGEMEALEAAFHALQKHLAVGPAPEVRACPGCHRDIVREATLCGYCWTKSAPPGDAHA